MRKYLKLWKLEVTLTHSFFDFEKVFDKVDYGLLCQHMREKRIIEKIDKWILKDRIQYVLDNTKISTGTKVICGILEGSV